MKNKELLIIAISLLIVATVITLQTVGVLDDKIDSWWEYIVVGIFLLATWLFTGCFCFWCFIKGFEKGER